MEIERKFLLANAAWRDEVVGQTRMRQGYLVDARAWSFDMARCSVRVRVAGEQAWLNIKSAETGIAREEFEYSIPPDDAERMLEQLCSGCVVKTRHLVVCDEATFEIDEFAGANEGLVVAEVELASVDSPFPRPSWLGREVSHLPRYFNVNLLAHPWQEWSADEREAEDA